MKIAFLPDVHAGISAIADVHVPPINRAFAPTSSGEKEEFVAPDKAREFGHYLEKDTYGVTAFLVDDESLYDSVRCLYTIPEKCLYLR